MSEIRKSRIELKSVEIVEVSSVEVGEGVHAFSRAADLHRIAEDGATTCVKAGDPQQGFVDVENLERMQAGLSYERYAPFALSTDFGRFTPALISAAGRERIRRIGSPCITYVMQELSAANEIVMPNTPNFVREASRMGYEDIAFMVYHDHSVYDANGLPIPHGVLFEYTSGLDSDTYDLEAVVAHLSQSPEFVFVDSDNEETDRPISRIPYYARHDDDDYRDHVQFMWRPSDESWARLLKVIEFDPEYPSSFTINRHAMISQFDFFGLDAFRVADHSARNR